eukprot:9766864-Alexandrium_andersonii.AAC.1
MSASLVGSEMCIRDSPAAACCGPTPLSSPGLLPLGVGSTPDPAVWAPPVLGGTPWALRPRATAGAGAPSWLRPLDPAWLSQGCGVARGLLVAV